MAHFQGVMHFDSLPNDKIFNWFKMKAVTVADYSSTVFK